MYGFNSVVQKRRAITSGIFVSLLWPLMLFIAIVSERHVFMGPFTLSPEARWFKKNKNKPTVILAKMIAAQTIKDLGLPKEYNGEKILTCRDATYYQNNKRFSCIKVGDIYFDSNESWIIQSAMIKAKSLREKKNENDRESSRQLKSLDLICGTSSKNTVEK